MSSRGGRGYGGYNSRGGGYGGRGGGYRGSYRGSSNRGGYESRGGRGGGGYSSYNSETRYNSGGGNRYSSSRDRIDESYKKPYRSESTGYSRDYNARSGSPERKRIRMEGSSSERRSHDGGGHYGGSYSGRQESYGGERRSFGEDRRRSPARESYRKPSGMGPPREPLRSAMRPRASRRSFRGRTMRSRGSFRGAPRSRGSFASRRYGERSLGYTRAFRSMKGRSPAKSKEDEASSTEEDWDADEKDEDNEIKKEPKSPKVDEDNEEEASEGGGDTDKEADAASEPAPRPRAVGTLQCVHCKEKCNTYGGYSKHLISSKHRIAMGAVARRHKAQLLRMRVAQRDAQRELETGAGADLATRTAFCLICRLNHRTTRHAHNLTDTHRAMKRFLMPFCRVCNMSFRSPMLYEHHMCSVEHLKAKAENPGGVIRRSSPKEADVSGDEGMDVDLDKFMTLDSVGDVDEVEDEDSGGEKKEETSTPKKPKVEINIGNEHIKKVEVYWCELCRLYLPRAEAGSAEQAEALRRHCRMRIHLRRYVTHRDTRTLRKQAERIHRQLHQQRAEEEKESLENSTDKVKEEKPEDSDEGNKKLENGTSDANHSGKDDKLWAEMDKDLAEVDELLSEVRQQEGSDDEEDLLRYDKFRKSDKKGKVGETEDKEGPAAEVADETKNNEVDAPA